MDVRQLQRCTEMAFELGRVNVDPTLEEKFRTRFGGYGLELEFRMLEEIDVLYMIVKDVRHRMFTIVLPGTETPPNIELDLNLALVPDERLGINLHEGFARAATLAYADVRPLIPANYRIEIHGYSLGGAVAPILGLHLMRDDLRVEEVNTFGQPKVTDAAGVQAFADLPILRFISGNDPVVGYPPGDYRHFGDEIILLDGPYIVYLPMSDPRFDLVTALVVELNDDSEEDHLLYPQRVADKLGQQVLQVDIDQMAEFLLPG
jgi:hypothetical protein